jgi:hypothetical protein
MLKSAGPFGARPATDPSRRSDPRLPLPRRISGAGRVLTIMSPVELERQVLGTAIRKNGKRRKSRSSRTAS